MTCDVIALCLWVRQRSTKLHCDDCRLFPVFGRFGFIFRDKKQFYSLTSVLFLSLGQNMNFSFIEGSTAPLKISFHSWSHYIAFEFGESYWHYSNSYQNKGEILPLDTAIMLKDKLAQGLSLPWKSHSGQTKKKNIKIYSQCTVMTRSLIFPVLFTALPFGSWQQKA